MGRLVEVENVGVQIDNFSLVEPVSFSVDRGEGFAVMGPNGSGKTTLLRVLAGLRRATTGTLRVGDHPVNEQDPLFRRIVAGLIGRPPVARDLTVAEQLSLVAASWGASLVEAETTAIELLYELEIEHLEKRFAHELSSGQSQLYSLALTLARPFDLLILDEPEQRLDPDRVEVVAEALSSRLANGATLVFASHHVGLIESIATHGITLVESRP